MRIEFSVDCFLGAIPIVTIPSQFLVQMRLTIATLGAGQISVMAVFTFP
jgi:hypothetical protein